MAVDVRTDSSVSILVKRELCFTRGQRCVPSSAGEATRVLKQPDNTALLSVY